MGEAMKKIALIFAGTLAGLYAISGVILLIQTLLANDPLSVRGGAEIAASIVPPCIGLMICLACFQSAFRKKSGESG